MYKGNIMDMSRELQREVLKIMFNGATSHGNVVSLAEKTSTKHNVYCIIEYLEDDFSFPDFWIIAEKSDQVNDNIFIVFQRSLTVEEEITFRYVMNCLHIANEIEPHSMSRKFGIY